MAYENISKYQKTKNSSQRDIDQKFNLVEFNRIFEQNNLALKNDDEIKIDTPKCANNLQPILIIFIILIIGILLLLFENFIL